MAKITTQDIIDLNFVAEMFGKDAATFPAFITDRITEQSALLSGRIGASAYESATSPTQDYVKRAELCLTAAEMIQRRMNRILGNVVGTGNALDIVMEKKQRQDYLDEAESLILKIAAGVTTDSSDFASGVLTSSHFEDSSAISGLEKY